MFFKGLYSEKRLRKFFRDQVSGAMEFEDLHDLIRDVIKQAGVINARFKVSYDIRQDPAVERQGLMTYTVTLSGMRGWFFVRPFSVSIKFASNCIFDEPVQVEATTEIKQDRAVFEVTTLYHTFIGQGRGRRLIPGTDYLA
jgi:hypothetical protein